MYKFLDILIFGKASGKLLKTIGPSEDVMEQSILEMLRSHNFPIASSCNGKGLCKKCVVNDNIISCQISLRELIKKIKAKTHKGNSLTINIDYL